MKYIITESRLDEFRINYLNHWLRDKAISHTNPYIIISQQNQGDDEKWDDYMEYDYSDGRLWINRYFLSGFTDIYAFMNLKSAQEFISKWFENKFDVKIKFVE